jgi:hypothetical protein
VSDTLVIYSRRDVDQASGSSPRVEALNASHLRLLLTSAQISSSNQWADQPQAMIPQAWLLRKLRVLVALEQRLQMGLTVLRIAHTT